MKSLFVLLTILFIGSCSPQYAEPVTIFSTLKLTDTNGRAIKIEKIHPKWRLINFWATWCQPCREEMPALQQLTNQLSNKLDVMIISVDQDSNLVKEFLLKYQISIPSFITTEQRLAQQLRITQYPTTLLVSPQGKIVEKFIGAKDWTSPQIIKKMELYFGS